MQQLRSSCTAKASASHCSRSRRYHGVAKPSSVYLKATPAERPAVSATPEGIAEKQRHALEEALRIDQAGELAANYIYQGQVAILGRDSVVGPLLKASRFATVHLIYWDYNVR